jgi:hypothetical protein
MCHGDIASCGAVPIIILMLVGLVLLTGLIITIAITWIYCRIFSKAGYSWVLGLLTLIPIVNIIMLCVLGFGDWPVRKELRQLKQSAKT